MMLPLVSIIVPCFNQAKYLSEALDSIISQTYNNWECIIINDGSTDNTEEIAKNYLAKDNRFKYLWQRNSGVSSARNNGISNSNGEFILPLDADDLIDATYIEKVVAHFKCFPDTTLVYCNAELFGTINQSWDLPEYSFDEIIWENSIFCSAMYKRCDYEKTNGYNPNMKYGYEDWDFWLSLLNKNSIVYKIDQALFYYRQKTNSRNTSTTNYCTELYMTLIENHKELYLPYLNRIIEFKKDHEKLSAAYNSISNLLSSDEYRIGTMITKRFKLLGKIIIRIGNLR